jgi:hypothetical protein
MISAENNRVKYSVSSYLMRQAFINTIYQILNELEHKPINNGYSFLADPVPDNFIQSGLYFFFDPAIQRQNGGSKIIRIGKTGDNLNNRLNKHKNGPRDNSVFRQHVWKALTQLHNNPAAETDISNYIHPLPYLFLPVALLHLSTLEKRCIEIVSNRYQNIPIDAPVANWLGSQQGPGINNAISESHLWCVHDTANYQPNNHQIYSEALIRLESYVTNL